MEIIKIMLRTTTRILAILFVILEEKKITRAKIKRVKIFPVNRLTSSPVASEIFWTIEADNLGTLSPNHERIWDITSVISAIFSLVF